MFKFAITLPCSEKKQEPDLVDVLVDAYEQGMISSEEDLLTAVLDPIFAAHSVVATCASIVYSLLKHPDSLLHVQDEVDSLFR